MPECREGELSSVDLTVLLLGVKKYIDQTISLHLTQKNSDRLYMIRLNRTSDTLDVSYVNTSDGSINFLFEDINHPYHNWNYRQLAVINEGKELIYWSEKNGWGQLYLYDGNTGRLKNKITQGIRDYMNSFSRRGAEDMAFEITEDVGLATFL